VKIKKYFTESMNKYMKASRLFFLLIMMPVVASGQVKLPKLVSDGMVLQRDIEVKIWGWASAGEKISVLFNNASFNYY
jgi:sialate O-acetylesterase